MSANTLRPSKVPVGTDFFLVQHKGQNRTIINEVRMEASTGKETIKEMTPSDYITVIDPITNELIELVKDEKKDYLVIKDTKTRVTFWNINEETIHMKKLSDESITIWMRQQTIREEARANSERQKLERAATREARKNKVRGSTDVEKINKRIITLTKRIETNTLEIEKANIELVQLEEKLKSINTETVSV